MELEALPLLFVLLGLLLAFPPPLILLALLPPLPLLLLPLLQTRTTALPLLSQEIGRLVRPDGLIDLQTEAARYVPTPKMPQTPC
jgi:hypothetical protein